MHIKEFNILLCESDAEGEGLMALDMVKALFLLLYLCLFTYSPALVAPLLQHLGINGFDGCADFCDVEVSVALAKWLLSLQIKLSGLCSVAMCGSSSKLSSGE